jgi:5-methylcytosine-specific restriction endonuclease McrA
MTDKKRWANQYAHSCKERPDDFCNACYQKEYKKTNRVKSILHIRKLSITNSDKYNLARRKKYAEDPEYRKKIIDSRAKYYLDNKEKILKMVSIRNNNKRGGTRRTYWEMAVNLLIQRDGNVCPLCNETVEVEDASIDHIKEVRKGGGHEATNIRVTHKICNFRRPRPDFKPHNYNYDI